MPEKDYPLEPYLNKIGYLIILAIVVYLLAIAYDKMKISSYEYPKPQYTQNSKDTDILIKEDLHISDSNRVPNKAEIDMISRKYEGDKQKEMKAALCAIYQTC